MTTEGGTISGERKRGYTTRTGVTLNYRLWRPGRHRRLLVLIHGVASNLTRWTEFVENTRLRDDWDILRLDLRGHGESAYRGKLDMDIWCRDISDILDRERYQNAVLVGHSLGAQVALHFSALYPSRTMAIVLIDPVLHQALIGTMRTLYRLRFVIKAAVVVIRLLNRLGLRRRRIPQRDLQVLDRQTRAALLDAGKIEEMVRSYGSPWPDLKHFPTANFLQELVEIAAPVADIHAIKVPILALLSSAPTYTDIRATQRILGSFANAEVAHVDAYHWPLTEQPEQTRKLIEDWCSRLPAGRAQPGSLN